MTSTVPSWVVVASLQGSSDLGAIEANCKKFEDLAREAAAKDAKFIVMPETAITGYLSQDLKTNWHLPHRPNEFPEGKHPEEFAEPRDGPSTLRFAALAKELGVYITVPFLEVNVEEAEDDAAEGDEPKNVKRFYNSVSLVGPEGTVVGHYRKTSPWPHPEKSWATPGLDVTDAVVDTPYGRVGMAICFDIHSVLAKYARHRLWTLLYPIAWVGETVPWFRDDLPQLLQQVRCPHNIVGCNWSTDKEEEWPGSGNSTHYAPCGDILASTGDRVGSTIVYSHLRTAGASGAAPIGTLDLDKYAGWTSKQKQSTKGWQWKD